MEFEMHKSFKESKAFSKGKIYKSVTFVATCGECHTAEISNTHTTQRGFITELRKQGWTVSIDNEITCDACNGRKVK